MGGDIKKQSTSLFEADSEDEALKSGEMEGEEDQGSAVAHELSREERGKSDKTASSQEVNPSKMSEEGAEEWESDDID